MSAPAPLPAELNYPKRGEIWYIKDNPSIPNDEHLPRPVVVISTDNRNKTWNSIIVVPCSTSLLNVNQKFHTALPKGAGGLPKDCHARCDLVSNLPKDCLDLAKGAIGKLSEHLLLEIVRGVRSVIGDNPD